MFFMDIIIASNANSNLSTFELLKMTKYFSFWVQKRLNTLVLNLLFHHKSIYF